MTQTIIFSKIFSKSLIYLPLNKHTPNINSNRKGPKKTKKNHFFLPLSRSEKRFATFIFIFIFFWWFGLEETCCSSKKERSISFCIRDATKKKRRNAKSNRRCLLFPDKIFQTKHTKEW